MDSLAPTPRLPTPRLPTPRLIATADDLAEGAAWLALREPRFGEALALCGPLRLRRRREGFEAVLGAIVGQQVSVAAADAIWRRMEAARLTRPRAIARASEEEMRAVGLSRQKIRYARALAAARIDYRALRDAPHETVVGTLTAVPGVGVWTAEIYAMFSLRRADVFAPGDLALQEAARLLLGLPERPRERAFRLMAEEWAPWRSVAAHLLWAYYAREKAREGIR